LENEQRHESGYDWSVHLKEMEATLANIGYELLPTPDESLLVRAYREWGQIAGSLHIDAKGLLHFSMTRPLDQFWSDPLTISDFTFVVSQTHTESLNISHILTDQDCLRFRDLLQELENIGHANWKQLNTLTFEH
jgi:hypothetical protein